MTSHIQKTRKNQLSIILLVKSLHISYKLVDTSFLGRSNRILVIWVFHSVFMSRFGVVWFSEPLPPGRKVLRNVSPERAWHLPSTGGKMEKMSLIVS